MPKNEWQSLAGQSLKEKRVRIKLYLRTNVGRKHYLHDCFRLSSGEVYEGYISQVGKECLVFAWAFSPISPDDDLSEFEVPITSIEALL